MAAGGFGGTPEGSSLCRKPKAFGAKIDRLNQEQGEIKNPIDPVDPIYPKEPKDSIGPIDPIGPKGPIDSKDPIGPNGPIDP